MSTTYTYYREIYDVNGLYIYIKSTLSTISSVSYNNGTIVTYWPSSLSAGDKTTLDGLIVSYSNPQVLINQNNFRQISVGNSTTTPLAGNGTFTGFFEDVSDYSAITVTAISDVPSITKGLKIQFSSNGTNVDEELFYSIGSNGDAFSSTITARYVRVVYVNGATSQSSFRLQTIYHYYKASDQIQLYGKTTNSTIIPCTLGPNGGLSLNVQKTSFGQLSVESMFPLVQMDFTYSVNTETANTTLTGSGTVAQSGNTVLISSGAATSSSATLSSKKAVRYRIGQGIRSIFTPIFGTPASGNTQICGIGNSNDGFFFGYNGTAFGIMRRTGGVDNWIPQTSWNVDKMDGTGISGMTLKPQNGNVYQIQFQWLGYGMIVFAIEETSSGQFHPVHRIQYANTATTTTIQIPFLNCYAQSSNTTNNTNIQMNLCCFSAFVEGIPTFNGPKFGIDNNKTLNTNAFVPLVTIRNKTTFASKTNRISIYLRNFTAGTDTRQAVIALYKNATLTGAVYTDVNTNNSCVEYDTSATARTGGNIMFSFCLGSSTGMSQLFTLYELPLEPGEWYTVAARVPAAANTVVSAALNWVEDS